MLLRLIGFKIFEINQIFPLEAKHYAAISVGVNPFSISNQRVLFFQSKNVPQINFGGKRIDGKRFWRMGPFGNILAIRKLSNLLLQIGAVRGSAEFQLAVGLNAEAKGKFSRSCNCTLNREQNAQINCKGKGSVFQQNLTLDCPNIDQFLERVRVKMVITKSRPWRIYHTKNSK